MSAIIFQHDKRAGITYAYKSVSYWDKDKQQSRAKRSLIGRLNRETGEIEPTDGRRRTRDKAPGSHKESSRYFYGATYLLDAIGDKLGITSDLRECFPDSYRQILSIAYFLILEDASPLFRFEKWNKLHKHPHDQNIPSQRCSDLFASITESDKQKFFRFQGKRRSEREYWCYDTTSISSYSKELRRVRHGHNKEHDPLAQFNLAMVFGEQSNLPFYYRELAGNTPDSKTLASLLADLSDLGFKKVKLVLDRGFYSQENINALYRERVKFLQSARMSLALVRRKLDEIYDDFRSFESYDVERDLYARSITTSWDCSWARPYKGDVIKEKRRLYIHFYFNIDKAAEDEKNFDRKLAGLRAELEEKRRVPEHEKLYAKYFEVKETPKRGVKVTVNEAIVAKAKRYYGYFALLTNEKMDAGAALDTYRGKDVIEKAFGNLKERLNMRRALVSSEQSLNGKLFVEFIALIYLSYIKKQMQINKLFKRYTIQSALDELDLIECFERTGKKLRVGEILNKQRELYKSLGVESPSSL